METAQHVTVPPGVGKSHLAVGLGLKAIEHGYRVLFARAASLITALTKAATEGRLEERLKVYEKLIADLGDARRVLAAGEAEERKAVVHSFLAGIHIEVTADTRCCSGVAYHNRRWLRWWRWEELNLRHGAYETPALPLSYTAELDLTGRSFAILRPGQLNGSDSRYSSQAGQRLGGALHMQFRTQPWRRDVDLRQPQPDENVETENEELDDDDDVDDDDDDFEDDEFDDDDDDDDFEDDDDDVDDVDEGLDTELDDEEDDDDTDEDDDDDV